MELLDGPLGRTAAGRRAILATFTRPAEQWDGTSQIRRLLSLGGDREALLEDLVHAGRHDSALSGFVAASAPHGSAPQPSWWDRWWASVLEDQDACVWALTFEPPPCRIPDLLAHLGARTLPVEVAAHLLLWLDDPRANPTTGPTPDPPLELTLWPDAAETPCASCELAWRDDSELWDRVVTAILEVAATYRQLAGSNRPGTLATSRSSGPAPFQRALARTPAAISEQLLAVVVKPNTSCRALLRRALDDLELRASGSGSGQVAEACDERTARSLLTNPHLEPSDRDRLVALTKTGRFGALAALLASGTADLPATLLSLPEEHANTMAMSGLLPADLEVALLRNPHLDTSFLTARARRLQPDVDPASMPTHVRAHLYLGSPQTYDAMLDDEVLGWLLERWYDLAAVAAASCRVAAALGRLSREDVARHSVAAAFAGASLDHSYAAHVTAHLAELDEIAAGVVLGFVDRHDVTLGDAVTVARAVAAPATAQESAISSRAAPPAAALTAHPAEPGS